MAIISDYQEEEKPDVKKKASASSSSTSLSKTSSFSATFDTSNPLGFLEKVFEFVAKESDFLAKDSAEKQIQEVVRAAKEKRKEEEDLEKYSWTQNLQEVSVKIPVPAGTKLNFVVKKNYLKVGLKGQPPIIEGKLCQSIKPDDCYWSREDQNSISILLTKQNQMEWKSLLKGDPEFDQGQKSMGMQEQEVLKKFKAEHPETWKTVEMMMFDQRQKSMGMQEQEFLKKFKAEHPETWKIVEKMRRQKSKGLLPTSDKMQ